MVNEKKTTKRSRPEIQEAIRQAAIEEFALHGLRGATTQSIAERAQLSKAQLHYYIESKEALYVDLLQMVVSEWSRESFNERDGDPARVLASYVKRKLEFSFRQPLLSKMFANELISGAEVLHSILTQPRTRAGQAIQTLTRWIEEGKIRPLDPWLFLMHIWAVTQHYADFDVQVRFMMRLRAGEALDQARITREVVAFVLHGCGLSPTEEDLA
ncbi:TetR/AcrR family transcriptional regulator [Variovorax sp. M-6]|uniref:TetR/AcrR family transcriptional regulator n=1 Tax=Variovorax sp. M-6 TaxID=3233041 RepID=UPI003F9B9E00